VDRLAEELFKEAEGADATDFSEVAWRLLELVVHDVCDYLRPDDGRQVWFETWMAKLVSTMQKAAAKSIGLLCTADRIAELAAVDDEEGDGGDDQPEVVELKGHQEGDVAIVPEGAEEGTSL
jgi:hypothetical protein